MSTNAAVSGSWHRITGDYRVRLDNEGMTQTVDLRENDANVYLPTAVGYAGWSVALRNVTEKDMRLHTTDNQHIDNCGPGVIRNGEVTIISDGANWRIVIDSPPPKPRRSRKLPPDILALRRFVRAMEKCDWDQIRAAINWLESVYPEPVKRWHQ